MNRITFTLLSYTILIPLSVYSQQGFDKVYKKYAKEDKHSAEQLELFYEHRFEYSWSSPIGQRNVKGTWQQKGDTLYLAIDNKPWDISLVTEQYIDSLRGKTAVYIRTENTDYQSIATRNTITKSSTITDSFINVEDFEVWINDDCNTKKTSEKDGSVSYSGQPIRKLNFDCGEYIIKNTNSNYFVATLNSFPIHTSPPAQFTKTKWLITATGGLTPINCD